MNRGAVFKSRRNGDQHRRELASGSCSAAAEPFPSSQWHRRPAPVSTYRSCHEENLRDYALTKDFSLRLHFVLACLQLRATGLFEFNFHDERYLPFEFHGAGRDEPGGAIHRNPDLELCRNQCPFVQFSPEFLPGEFAVLVDTSADEDHHEEHEHECGCARQCWAPDEHNIQAVWVPAARQDRNIDHYEDSRYLSSDERPCLYLASDMAERKKGAAAPFNDRQPSRIISA